jgi:hypothetical protein
MEWDVKQDWPNSTGGIKFEILCQDGSRDKPVDLHFLKLPFADGNMTISRSPLKDSDFVNYAKFLLATGQAQFESDTSNAVFLPAEANTTEVFTFTNCGKGSRTGPSEAQIQTEYNGTNLAGKVTTGFMTGYQQWTVPAAGDYWIEAVGAGGGKNDSGNGGLGARMLGKFSLLADQNLTIVVGQRGANRTNNYGSGGGGGTFVVADRNDTPLIIAGGGGGASSSSGRDASIETSGTYGQSSTWHGGSNGNGGKGANGGGGGGFIGNGIATSTFGGKSFQNGAMGGTGTGKGGFGGGGSGGGSSSSYADGGGGGGYSGGGGSAPGPGGGGGSFNSGTNQRNIPAVEHNHGFVKIYRAEGNNPTRPSMMILDSSWSMKSPGALLLALGSNYSFATTTEVNKAREAATPGGVNNWTATNQVKPRNLPGKVNEYGFDVSTTSGYWVIKE